MTDVEDRDSEAEEVEDVCVVDSGNGDEEDEVDSLDEEEKEDEPDGITDSVDPELSGFKLEDLEEEALSLGEGASWLVVREPGDGDTGLSDVGPASKLFPPGTESTPSRLLIFVFLISSDFTSRLAGLDSFTEIDELGRKES